MRVFDRPARRGWMDKIVLQLIRAGGRCPVVLLAEKGANQCPFILRESEDGEDG